MTAEQQAALEAQWKKEQELQDLLNAQANADWYGNYGDYSQAAAMGVDTSYMKQLQALQLAQAEASGTVSTQKITQKSDGDDDSGGTGYEALFQAAMASGYPQSYIANHYKEYGFTSSTGIYNDYQTWAANQTTDWGSGYSTTQNVNGMKASEWGAVKNNILANLRNGNFDNVNKYLDQVAGGMSKEQWNEIAELLEKYGYKNVPSY
jgi:hypothetical protein